MQVILRDKVAKLGSLGEKVSVKPGYARNYLIPKGKAVVATEENIKNFEVHRAKLEAELNVILDLAKTKAAKMSELGTITIAAKSGDGGRLFGSIGARDIADVVSAAGIEITKGEVRLPNGVLRTLGEHEVNFHLHHDVSAKLNVIVVEE